MPKKIIPTVILVFLISTFSSCSCIYFNTFHNIRKNFNSAQKSRQKDGREKAKGAEVSQYNIAIEKSSRVLEKHPNSSYVDDALYIIGTSYYYLEEYDNSARKFRELFANYPESEYIPSSRLMFAKAKMQLNEEAEAVVIFEEILEEETVMDMKSRAARALGQYYFEIREYEKANVHLQSLIDSLGDASDRLRAYIFMADGYYDRFLYNQALENYEQALEYDPDTLQYYDIIMRMAQCDYFLSDIASGLNRLRELEQDDTYYNSLPEIRLMMAEGYEWDGDIDAAIDIYNKITEESKDKEIAAQAYYYLGLIYQYNYENLKVASRYYSSAAKIHRGSAVHEDAIRRSSNLARMEMYQKRQSEKIEGDTAVALDQDEIDRIGESSYLLGELFYFDLEKPDSAMHEFQALLEHYPMSRYAPRAMISMAYIYRTEYDSPQNADSILRQILRDYPHSDEAEDVINMLGLSGTVADTGYPARVFEQGESFFEKFMKLDSTRYYYRLLADSLLADSLRKADSIRVADSLKAADSLIQADSSLIADSTGVSDSLIAVDMELGDSEETVADLVRAQAADRETPPETVETLDSLLVIDSIWTLDSSWTFDSIWSPPDSLWRYDSTYSYDSIWRIDSLPVDSSRIDSIMVFDSSLLIDSVFVADSVLTIDSILALDSSITIDSSWAMEGDTVSKAEEDVLVLRDYWQQAFEEAFSRYNDKQIMLLDSARFYYSWVIDSFPLSKYNAQAQYVLLYIYDNYLAPGDSSMIDLYGAFVDSFPNSPYTDLIAEQYNIRPLGYKKEAPVRKSDEMPGQQEGDDPSAEDQSVPDTTQEQSAESRLISDAEGNVLPPANEYYLDTEIPFVYPLQAVAYNIQDKLYFHIRIDFNGEVDELILMNPTASDELNENIRRTVEESRFDAGQIPPELYDHWFYYTYTVIMPQEYR